jgi:DNA-binding response OmpR family regulator
MADCKSILIINADRGFGEETAELLRSQGHTVMALESGDEGLRWACEFHPSLIVLDALHPAMNGYAICRSLCAQPAIGHPRVVLLTALNDDDLLRNYGALRDLGVDEALSKPVQPQGLASRVLDLLHRGVSAA